MTDDDNWYETCEMKREFAVTEVCSFIGLRVLSLVIICLKEWLVVKNICDKLLILNPLFNLNSLSWVLVIIDKCYFIFCIWLFFSLNEIDVLSYSSLQLKYKYELGNFHIV